ncbi:MAG TPA: DoxX family protein [Candidatus Bathyarchaeia archaeon]|nr:DoxX family protein [Candidatus Bathyarchaeia archaeon]
MLLKKYPEIGTLIVRVVVGLVFFMHGLSKFQGGLAGTAGFFEKMGIPGFMAYVVASIELIGGLLVIIGIGSQIIPVLFAAIMLVVMFIMPPGERGFFSSHELHICLLAMSVYLTLSGSKLFALEQKLFARKQVG